MTLKQIKKFKEKFQNRLKLQGWKIDLKLVEEFQSEGIYGSADTQPIFQTATIRIKKSLKDQDLKETIVHELLHVRFGGIGFEEGSARGLAFETGIEMTARALLDE